ncbi:MAG: hypothetical protein WCA46_30665 [Actinocatenispora sp.]
MLPDGANVAVSDDGCIRVGGSSDSHETCTDGELDGRKYKLNKVVYDTGAVQYQVSAHRPDGTRVYVFSSNFDPADVAGQKFASAPQPDASAPVLSVAQAAAVALNPDLHG